MNVVVCNGLRHHRRKLINTLDGSEWRRLCYWLSSIHFPPSQWIDIWKYRSFVFIVMQWGTSSVSLAHSCLEIYLMSVASVPVILFFYITSEWSINLLRPRILFVCFLLLYEKNRVGTSVILLFFCIILVLCMFYVDLKLEGQKKL